MILESGTDGLAFTSRWLKKSFNELDLDPAELGISSLTQILDGTESIKFQQYTGKIVNHAYLEILTWDAGQVTFPETLLLDQTRLLKSRNEMRQLILVGSCLLVTFSSFPALQSLAEFKETLKEHLLTLVGDDPLKSDAEKLASCAVQILSEVKSTSAKHAISLVLDASREQLFKSQVTALSEKESNRIRKVVQRRMCDFIEGVLTSPSTSSGSSSSSSATVQIPSGLSVLQKELTSLAAHFVRVVTYNRSVFGEYYTQLVSEFLADRQLKSFQQ